MNILICIPGDLKHEARILEFVDYNNLILKINQYIQIYYNIYLYVLIPNKPITINDEADLILDEKLDNFECLYNKLNKIYENKLILGIE